MKKSITLFSLLLLLTVGNSCRKKVVDKPLETSTVTDIDGKTYQTVKIGDQWWMAENLDVTHYNDGSLIPEIAVEADSAWAAQTSGACCNVDVRYGRLYNWYAVNDAKKIAPAGWHIPTDAEWKAMEISLGMTESDANETAWRGTNQGEQLIPAASEGWPSASLLYGSNKSGFTGLPGGCRLFNGTINNESSTAFWWTSTPEDGQGWYRYLDSPKKQVFRQHTYKTYGLSIRCVKD